MAAMKGYEGWLSIAMLMKHDETAREELLSHLLKGVRAGGASLKDRTRPSSPTHFTLGRRANICSKGSG